MSVTRYVFSRPALLVSLLATATLLAGGWVLRLNQDNIRVSTVRDSAGVTMVSNTDPLLDQNCIALDTIPVLIIRSGTGAWADPFLSGTVGGVVLGDGRVALLDAGSRELRLYSASGTYLGFAGGPGHGPGEFVEPTWLGRGGADTLLVWDDAQRRLTAFDRTGRLLSSRLVAADGGERVGPSRVLGRFGDGSYFTGPGGLFQMPRERGQARIREPYGKLDAATGHVATLVEGRGSESVAGARGWYVLPFGKRDIAVAHGETLVMGDNGTSVLRYFGMDGVLVREVHWISHPAPVTDDDRDAHRQYAATISPRAVPPMDARYASVRPIFSGLHSAKGGQLWVESFTGGWESPGSWLVFNAEGRLLCRVSVPGRPRVLEIGDAYLLAVQQDGSGEETVTLYRHSGGRVGVGGADGRARLSTLWR